MEAVLMSIGRESGIHAFMALPWGWPFIETLHFIGLCLLIGTVGLFDLRMMGYAKAVPLAALHKLLPVGIAGFVLNIITGIMFIVTDAGQYIYNPAFQLKVLFIMLAGANVLVFYAFYHDRVQLTAVDANCIWQARVIAGISLFCWLAVITAGRLITFFRPPDFWCFWCS